MEKEGVLFSGRGVRGGRMGGDQESGGSGEGRRGGGERQGLGGSEG